MKSKELRLEARERLKNKWSKVFSISLFFVIISYIANYISQSVGNAFSSVELVGGLIDLIFLIFLLPLSFGVTVSIIRLMKDETVSLTDFINIGFQNISNVWKVLLNIFVKLLIPFVIFTSIVFAITYLFISTSSSLNLEVLYLFLLLIIFAFLIFTFIMIIPYALSMITLYENPNKSGKEIIDISVDLMKDNKLKYIYLILSFIGWFLLVFIVLSILNYFLPLYIINILSYAPNVLLTPYITATLFVFYENLNSKEKKEENLENITEE